MEHLRKRRRIATEEYSDPEFHVSRARNDQRLKSTFESIFKKYNKDFSEVGDEIDMDTGQIVVDNGHILGMADEMDLGEEGTSSEEEDVGDSDNDSDQQQSTRRTHPNYHDHLSLDIWESNSAVLDQGIVSDSDSDNDSLMGAISYRPLKLVSPSTHKKNYGKLGREKKTGSELRRMHVEHTPNQLHSVEDGNRVCRGAGKPYASNDTKTKGREKGAVEPAWWVPSLPQLTSMSKKQCVVATPEVEEPRQPRSLSPSGTSLWALEGKGRRRLSIKSRVVSSSKIASIVDTCRKSPAHLQRQVKETHVIATTDGSSGTSEPRVTVLPSETHAVSQYKVARNSSHGETLKLDNRAVTKVSSNHQKWTPAEDELLRRLKLLPNLSYDEIKQHFPGRGEPAIRYLLHSMLGYMQPEGPISYRWTPRDSDKLLDLRLRQNLSWERVAENFENRTTKGVQSHFQKLKIAFATPGHQSIATSEEMPRALAVLTNVISAVTHELSKNVLKPSVSHKPAQQITPPSSVKSQPKSIKAVHGKRAMDSTTVISPARPALLPAETTDGRKVLACAVPSSSKFYKATAAVRTTISDAPDKSDVHATTAIQTPIRNISSSHNPDRSSNSVPLKLHHRATQLKPKRNASNRSSVQQNTKTKAISTIRAVIVASPTKDDNRNLTTPKLRKQNSTSPTMSPLSSTTSDQLSAVRHSLLDEEADELEFNMSHSAKTSGKLETRGSRYLDETGRHERPLAHAQSKPIVGTTKNSSAQLCRNCKTKSNCFQWRRGEDGETLCNNCGTYWARHGLDRPKSVRQKLVKQKSARKLKRSQILLDHGRNPILGLSARNEELPTETASHSTACYTSARISSEAPKGAGNAVSLIRVPDPARQSGSSEVYPQQNTPSLRPVGSSFQRELCSSPITSIENPSVPPRRHMVFAHSFSSIVGDLSEDELSFL